MSTATPPRAGPESLGRGALFVQGLIWLGALILFLAAVLFLASGDPGWTMGWVLIGLLAVSALVNLPVLILINPEVVEERLGRRAGARRWDRVLVFAMGALYLAALVVAGLQHRSVTAPQVSLALQIFASFVFALGNALFLWALAVNKFFSKMVCIQHERGHRVVTAGPYRYVRHPGYVGWILMGMTPPLILGSLWATIPVAPAVCLIVLRTWLEDRTLQKELEGYSDYSRRVRQRLLPRIW